MNQYSRFRADCWTVNTSVNNSVCLLSEKDNTFEVYGIIRDNKPIYIKWNSQDSINHSYCSYPTNYNYKNTILSFNIQESTTPLQIRITDNNGATEEFNIDKECYIDFNTLQIDIENIANIEIITILNKKYHNIKIIITDINLDIILGNENPNIISNNFSLVENYDTCYSFCPRRLVNEMKKIGFTQNINLTLGDRKFCELTNVQTNYIIDNNITKPDLYVDSVNGNDTNDGKTKDTPLKNIPVSNTSQKIALMEGEYILPSINSDYIIFGYQGQDLTKIQIHFPIELPPQRTITFNNLTANTENEKLFITEEESFFNNGNLSIVIQLKDCHSNISLNSLSLDPTVYINSICKKWIKNYMQNCESQNIQTVNIGLNNHCKYIPKEWRQMYHDGQYAQSDNAFLYDLNNNDVHNYITGVVLDCISLFKDVNYIPSIQLNKVQWQHTDNDIAIYNSTRTYTHQELANVIKEYILSILSIVQDNKGILGLSISLPEQGDSSKLTVYNHPLSTYDKLDYIEIQDFDWVISNSKQHQNVYTYLTTLNIPRNKTRYLSGVAKNNDYDVWNNIINALNQATYHNIEIASIWTGHELRRDNILLPSNYKKEDIHFEQLDDSFFLKATIDNQSLGYPLMKIKKQDVNLITSSYIDIPYDVDFVIDGMIKSTYDIEDKHVIDGELEVLIQEGNNFKKINSTYVRNGNFQINMNKISDINKYNLILKYNGNKFYNTTSSQITLNVRKRYVYVQYDQTSYAGYPEEEITPILVFKDECGNRLSHLQFLYYFNNQKKIDTTNSSGTAYINITIPNQIKNDCTPVYSSYKETIYFKNGIGTIGKTNVIPESIQLEIDSVLLEYNNDFIYDNNVIKLKKIDNVIGHIQYKTNEILYEARRNAFHIELSPHPYYQMDYSINDRSIYTKKIDTEINISDQIPLDTELLIKGSIISEYLNEIHNVQYGNIYGYINKKNIGMSSEITKDGNFEFKISYNDINNFTSNNISEYNPINYNIQKITPYISLKINKNESYQGEENEFIATCTIKDSHKSFLITDGMVVFVVNDGSKDIDKYVGELDENGNVNGYIHMTKPGKYFIRAVYIGMFEYNNSVSNNQILVIKEK